MKMKRGLGFRRGSQRRSGRLIYQEAVQDRDHNHYTQHHYITQPYIAAYLAPTLSQKLDALLEP